MLIFLILKNRKQLSKKTKSKILHNEESSKYYCKICNNYLTDSKNKIEINSENKHTFFNPNGVIYNIQCFSMVEGVTTVGEKVSQFSWFPPNKWEIIICSVCHTHLGWRFSGEEVFYGLITDNIYEK